LSKNKNRLAIWTDVSKILLPPFFQREGILTILGSFLWKIGGEWEFLEKKDFVYLKIGLYSLFTIRYSLIDEIIS
jgi:hypothetical protein